jgi:hypothetical protein
MSEPTDFSAGLNLREQLARIDNIMADTQKKQREHANLAVDRQTEDREHIARIDKLLAEAQKQRREYHMQPWQVAATVFGGGAALFAAGAAFVKLVGG